MQDGRHKTARMGASTAGTMLALPAAISLGVVLARPALAQSVISGNHNSTVNLAAYPGGNPVSITAGSTIAPRSGDALVGLGGGPWSLANAGLLNAPDVGILLDTVGSVANAGVISAGYNGLSLNRGGTLSNAMGGSISGGHIGVYTGNGLGDITNEGVISASAGDAVSLYAGGSFTNASGARVLGGYSGVYARGTGTSIQNAGTITGPNSGLYLEGAVQVTNSGSLGGGDGIFAYGSGTGIDNTGRISGAKAGVLLDSGAELQNSGTITGGLVGALLGAGGHLTNQAGGLIEGGNIGVQTGSDAVIDNAGTILDGTVAGMVLGAQSSLDNSGVIGGVTGLVVSGAGSSVFDTGVIAATPSSGEAIALNGTDFLTLSTGAEIFGAIDGGGSASEIFLQGTGTLASTLQNFGAGSALGIAQGADWVASGQWEIAQVENAGTFQPGIIGTPLALTGNFTQVPGGTTRVLVTPSQTTEFNVSGVAQLGGALVYVLAPGSYAPGSENFLTAGGGIVGRFRSVTAVADAPASPALVTPPMVLALADATHQANLVVAQAFTVAPADDALFADANQAMALAAEQAGDTLLGHASGARSDGCAGALTGDCLAGAWVEAVGDNIGQADAFGASGGGFLAGLDRRIGPDGTRLGLALGVDALSLNDTSGGKAGMKTVRVGLYGAQPLGRMMLSASLIDGIMTGSTTRATGAGTALADSSANVLAGAAQLALPLVLDGWRLTPAAGLEFAAVNSGAMTETARTQAFAIATSASGGTSLRPYLRMAFSHSYITQSQWVVIPQASLGLAYQTGDPQGTVMITAHDGTPFATRGTPLSPASGLLMAGISVTRGRWSLRARYVAQVSGNGAAQTLDAAILIRF